MTTPCSTEAGAPSVVSFPQLSMWQRLHLCYLKHCDPYNKRVMLLLWRRLEFDDVFLVDFFSDSPVQSSGWRVLMQLLDDYKAVVETIARYAAALQAKTRPKDEGDSLQPKTWEELASSMTAGEMRKLIARARSDKSPLARAAVDAADHSDMLKTLPTSARLMQVPPSNDGAQEAGWLRPVEFNLQQHSLLCEELKHL